VGRRRAAPELIAAAGELAVLRDRERPSGRLLRQGEMDASYVDLADARHLEFDYLRRMRDLVDAFGARVVVHVGGAGCALARALAAADPGARQEVIELDPAVVELARAHLGLRRAPGLRVRVGDGRAVLARRRDGSVDAVLVDAFSARAGGHAISRRPRRWPTSRASRGWRRSTSSTRSRCATRPRSRPAWRARSRTSWRSPPRRCWRSAAAATSCWRVRTSCLHWTACAPERPPTAHRPRC
jgi:hypothetical protein